MVEKKQITRRQFLVTGASIVGASALCISGAGLAIQAPDVEYYSSVSTSGGKKKMLIAYATMAGSTGEIAAEIGNVLGASGYAVDVKRVDDILDVTEYQAMIIGSAIHSKTWLPEAQEFVKTYRHALSKIPVAYFTNSITKIAPDGSNASEEIDHFLDGARQEVPEVVPFAVGHFAGVLDFNKLPFAFRLIWPLTPGGKVKQGDYRDWEAIKAWAGSLVPAFA